ncbi:MULTISPECIES: hypothetical protein [Microbacterium]|uniref:hypothetical protein n=1 Tax=Microbacterium TaxID=33882 RepID=UPI001888C631|nr:MULTISPECIES: hypothetical protein [Microbacterium]
MSFGVGRGVVPPSQHAASERIPTGDGRRHRASSGVTLAPCHRDDRGITEWGASPNKLASLGLNVILLANLVGAGWLQLRFVRARTTFERLERWQTGFLPVYLAWAAIVVVVFPPLFGYA